MFLPKSKEGSDWWSARVQLMLLDRSEHSRSQNVLHTSHANSFTDKEENTLCQIESPLIKILQTAAKAWETENITFHLPLGQWQQRTHSYCFFAHPRLLPTPVAAWVMQKIQKYIKQSYSPHWMVGEKQSPRKSWEQWHHFQKVQLWCTRRSFF